MRRDLLAEIASCSGRTHALVLTHNVDPFFVQTMVLRALRRCGHPSLTVFADGPSARETYGRGRELLVGLGRRYRVVPVDLGPRRRWHPKAVLLAGPDAATLWVGSGNLTFGGWRDNAEVWLRYDAAADGTGPFRAVQALLTEALGAHVPLAGAVAHEVEAAFSGRWTEVAPGGHRVVGRVDGPALLDEVLGPDRPTLRRLTVLSPYFDAGGAAVRAWRDKTGAVETDVLVSAVGHDLGSGALGSWGADVRARTVQGGTGEGALVHAKAVRLEHTDGRVTGWVGSANQSVAAWLADGPRGNVELVAEVTGELAGEMFDELTIGGPPDPVAAAPEPPVDPDDALVVLAARWDRGVLRVAWRGPVCEELEVIADNAVLGAVVGMAAELSCPTAPGWLVVVGRCAGRPIRSAPMWVDDEGALATGATTRVLAGIVESDGAWARFEPDAWHRVMAHVARYVETERAPSSGGGAGRAAAAPGEPFSVPFAALFVAAGRTTERELVHAVGPGSLQGLIRRVLGLSGDDEDVDPPPAAPEAKSGDEGEVDEQPESWFDRAPEPRLATEIERRRILSVTGTVTETLGRPGWCEDRGAAGVRSSLGLVGSLFGAAAGAGWLTPDELTATQDAVWPTLFHDHAGLAGLSAEDQERVASPDVAAALAAWAYGACRGGDAASVLRGRLRWAALMARWPALTHPPDATAVAAALASILGDDPEEVLAARAEVWELAGVLSELAAQLRETPVVAWRERVADVAALGAGVLVWAADRFWMTQGAARRGDKDKVVLIAVNAAFVREPFQARFVVPIDVLVDRGLLQVSQRGREVLTELRSGATVSRH